MSEIGSFFSLSGEAYEKIKGEDRDLPGVAVSLGRQGISLVLKSLPRKTPRRALVPEYTCQSVLDPFLSMGYEIIPYAPDEHLGIAISQLNELIERHLPGVLIIHPYFGFPTITEDAVIHSRETIIIMDETHSRYSEFNYNWADFYVVSLRKWGPLPDGALVYGQSKLKTECLRPSREALAKKILQVFHDKAYYLASGQGDKPGFLRAHGRLSRELQETDDLFAMSRISRRIYLAMEASREAIIERRRRNYARLESFDWSSLGRPLFSLKEGCTPLYFPLLLTEVSRTEYQGYLIDRDIYAPIIWPTPPALADKPVSEAGGKLRRNLLCLPVDQRYGDGDMERILRVTQDFINRKS